MVANIVSILFCSVFVVVVVVFFFHNKQLKFELSTEVEL